MSSSLNYLKNHLTPIELNITCWTGQKKLKPSDLGLSDSDLPSNKVAALGTKKIYDTKTLNKLVNKRTNCRDYLDKIGIRFMGGWAIPTARKAEAISYLETKMHEFDILLQELANAYEAGLSAWAAECEADHSGLGEVIKQAAPTRADVLNRYSFEIRTQDDAYDGIGNTLLDEIANRAREFHQSLSGRTNGYDRKMFAPLREIRDKLNGLVFVDKSVGPIVARLDNFMTSIPTRGKLEISWLHELCAELKFLSDPSSVKEWAALNQALAADTSMLADQFVSASQQPEQPAENVSDGDDSGFNDSDWDDCLVQTPEENSSLTEHGFF